MYKDLGVDEDRVWDFVDTYKQRYKIISKKNFTFENTFEAVELASKLEEISVVTTKTRMYTMPLLEHFNIAQFFSK